MTPPRQARRRKRPAGTGTGANHGTLIIDKPKP